MILNSLTASKDPKHPWIAVVTATNGFLKLYILDWRASTIQASIDLNDHDLRSGSQTTLAYLSHVDKMYGITIYI